MTASGRTPRRTSSGNTSAALPSRPTEIGFLSRHDLLDHRERLVEVFGLRVEVAGLQPHLDAARLALDGEARGAGHRRRERLRAAHAAEAGGQDPAAGEIAAIVLAADLDEGLVGALHDALAADVDPRAGRHLAVHHQALAIELVEVVPGRPVRHEVRVGDQHARRVGVGAEDADRLARLDEQRLVVLQRASAPRRCGRSSPSRARRGRCRRRRRARRAARPPPGSRLFISMRSGASVSQLLARELGAARGADDAGVVDAGHASVSSLRLVGEGAGTRRRTAARASRAHRRGEGRDRKATGQFVRRHGPTGSPM